MIVPAQALTAEAGIRAAQCELPQSPPLNIGFTITHTRIAPDAQSLCASEGGSADVSGRDVLIAHYDDPAVRTYAVQTLDHLRQSGASVTRTAFWFRSAEDLALDRAKPARDPLGLMLSENGVLPERYVINLVRFSEDVKQAGYRQLIIALGNQGRSDPTCRGSDVWGACYDPHFDPLTWSVAEQMIGAVKHDGGLTGLDVIFEIAGESCFIHDPNSLLERNLEHYARYMADRYSKAFRDNKFIISCGIGESQHTLRTLADTALFFAELHPKPAIFDAHIYLSDPDQVTQMLAAADSTARHLGMPLMIGETFADNRTLFLVIKTMRQQNQLTSLRNLLVWPRHLNSKCEIDVDPVEILRWVVPALAQP